MTETEVKEQEQTPNEPLDRDEIVSLIESTIARVVSELPKGEEPKSTKVEEPSETPVAGGLGAIERQAEEMVRQAAERVNRENERDGRLKSAEELIAEIRNEVKAITEAPPKQYRRLTKALWGTDD